MIHKIIGNITRTQPIVKGILILMGGTTSIQIINIAASPIITRIFSPEAFGVFGLFTSIASILTVSSALKLEIALPTCNSDKEFIDVLWISFGLNIAFSSLVALILLAIPFNWHYFAEVARLDGVVWLLPISVLLTGGYRILNYAAVRFKKYRVITYSQINQVVAKNLFQIGIGLFWPTALILITGTVLNQLTGIGTFFRYLYRQRVLNWPSGLLDRVKRHIHNYRDYIVYGAPAGLINAAGLYLPVPIIMFFYGAREAGLMSFCITLVSIPLRVMGTAVSQAYIGETAELIRNKKRGLSDLYKMLLKRLSLVTLLPSTVILIWGEPLFTALFGENWGEAGHYLQILAVPFALRFIASPLSQILNLIRQQRLQLLWDVFRLIVVVVTLILPSLYGHNINSVLYVYSAGNAAIYAGLILLCWISIRKYES